MAQCDPRSPASLTSALMVSRVSVSVIQDQSAPFAANPFVCRMFAEGHFGRFRAALAKYEMPAHGRKRAGGPQGSRTPDLGTVPRLQMPLRGHGRHPRCAERGCRGYLLAAASARAQEKVAKRPRLARPRRGAAQRGGFAPPPCFAAPDRSWGCPIQTASTRSRNSFTVSMKKVRSSWNGVCELSSKMTSSEPAMPA